MFEFTVEGGGHFPYDMLRYDCCWPYSQTDAARLDPSRHERRRVVMQSAREAGIPTVDRWDSFNWRIVGMDNLRDED